MEPAQNVEELKTAGVVLTAGVVVGLGAGMWLGWTINRPQKSLETPAPAIIQSDGSHVLERRPEAKPEPKHQLPAGSKLVRQVSVEVTPRTNGSSPFGLGAALDVHPQAVEKARGYLGVSFSW